MTNALAIRDEQHYLATVEEVRALAERIDSIGDAKSLADKARAMQVWAERARMGQDQVNLAVIAKLWAERRAGELLIASRENGDRDPGGRGLIESRPATQLADLGVSKHESSRYQRLAAIPADQFTEAVEQAQSEGSVSTARVTALAEQKFDQRVRDEFFPAPTPVFDAFWKACGQLIKKARADHFDEEWDAETRRQVRTWAPLMVERINEIAALAEDRELRLIEGAGRANQ